MIYAVLGEMGGKEAGHNTETAANNFLIPELHIVPFLHFLQMFRQ